MNSTINMHSNRLHLSQHRSVSPVQAQRDVEQQEVEEHFPDNVGGRNKGILSLFGFVVLALTALAMLGMGAETSQLYKTSSQQSSVHQEETEQGPRALSGWSSLKIATFVTTHLPDQHKDFLEQCWPPMVERSPMLQHSDVFLYTSEEPQTALLDTAFGRTNNVKIQMYNNTGYQRGAMQAVEDLIENRKEWFNDYDWIIRVNPDVIIRNDSAFFEIMKNPDIDAIFVNCREDSVVLHTDFFAVRPRALPEKTVEHGKGGAENHFTAQVQHVLDQNRHVWMPNAHPPREGECRVAGVNSPVIHRHRFLKHCATDFDHSDGWSF